MDYCVDNVTGAVVAVGPCQYVGQVGELEGFG